MQICVQTLRSRRLPNGTGKSDRCIVKVGSVLHHVSDREARKQCSHKSSSQNSVSIASELQRLPTMILVLLGLIS
eukprot:5600795-Amphidinium_carterae.2